MTTTSRKIAAKANGRVGLINSTFSHLNLTNFLPLYISQVRPILEYCSPIWNPILKGEVVEIEKVQHRATKLVPAIRDLPYPDRLQALNLTTLAYRRKRTDIIQVFRVVKGIDKINSSFFFNQCNVTNTRGHRLKFTKPRANTSLRLHSFSNRIINVWNSLPSEAIECKTINSFKSAINKAWADDPLKYDIPHDYSPLILQ